MQNSTVEFVKIRAPKGYAAKHVWAIMQDTRQFGEIVPELGGINDSEGIVGYTVYSADGAKYYSLCKSNRCGQRVSRAQALNACKQAARNMVRWSTEDIATA